MRVLIGCEESGIVRSAFRRRGHDAWSCDLEPAADGGPHFKGDVIKAIENHGPWDLIILHPPCDYLAVSGNRWYGKGTSGHHKRQESLDWTLDLIGLATDSARYVAAENPVSVLFKGVKDVQYVQPWQFGHPEMKKTGLWLFNLPPLKPTDVRPPPEPGTQEYLEWQKVWRMGPSEDRKKMRSRTYLGIAEAMADQWGSL